MKADLIPQYVDKAATQDVTPDRRAIEHAASISTCVASVDVILIEGCLPEALNMASWMRACGLNVVFGPDCCGIETPVIVVCARDLRSTDIGARVDAAREMFADAPLCAILGIRNSETIDADAVLHFDDARSVIFAAGLRFLTFDAP